MSKKERITVNVAGKEREIRFPVSALIKLKKEAGINISDLQSDEEKARDIETIVALIWAGLVTDDPDLTIDYLADNMELHELNEVAEKIGEAINQEGKKD